MKEGSVVKARSLLIAGALVSGAAVMAPHPAAAGAGAALGRSLRLGADTAVEPAGRCQWGFRKSTITGLCVRKTVRWPLLSWYN